MSSKELDKLFSTIRSCPYYNEENPPCNRIKKFEPVVNTFSPQQRFMIISSDPSGDTNKKLDDNVPHSDFALRFISLMFTGSDNETSVQQITQNFGEFQRIFNKYFYWTHFSKCYAQGNPNGHCAATYLQKEIALINPSLIISLGSKPVDFLLGKEKLSERVNKVIYYQKTPLIASLHPSRDWNLGRRPQYKFDETWQLVKRMVKYSDEDTRIIRKLLEE